MSNQNIFAYKDRLNDCQFEGVIEGVPVDDIYQTPTGKTIARTQFLIRQTDLLIPCVAIGKFAIKISSMIEQYDVVFIKASFRPHRVEDRLLFRFYVHYLVILQKNNAPSLRLHGSDKDNDLNEDEINKILADVLA